MRRFNRALPYQLGDTTVVEKTQPAVGRPLAELPDRRRCIREVVGQPRGFPKRWNWRFCWKRFTAVAPRCV